MDWREKLFGKVLVKCDSPGTQNGKFENVPTLEALSDCVEEGEGAICGIYFSFANISDTSDDFGVRLEELYKIVQPRLRVVQVVLWAHVGTPEGPAEREAGFRRSLTGKPWLAVPFHDVDTKRRLTQKYSIAVGVPTLVIGGRPVRDALLSDPLGERFPWPAPPIHELLRGVQLEGEKTKLYDELPNDSVRVFYFAAHWCPPCRAFSPSLCAALASVRKRRAKYSNTQLILVSSDSYPGISYGINEEGDAGEALFLTPYIESGKVDEGRRLARVALTEDIGIKSYSGYFTVNKTYNSNQFFWYFPPTHCKQSCNVVLWLQGGPGASSLIGLFNENGPIKLAYNTIEKRIDHLAIFNHLIYIDNPVGSGFSFTDDPKGYSTGQVQIGEELYSSVVQFLQLFPELQENKFYITGESYAGKYIPALAYTIHKKNPDAKIKVNLIGAAIGNGLCDPINQVGLYATYYRQHGIIDFNGERMFEEYQNKLIDLIKQEKWHDAYVQFDSMIFGDLIGRRSLLLLMTAFFYKYNYLYNNDYTPDFGSFIQKNEVRKQIHVGHNTFSDGNDVWFNLQDDYMKSVAPWISELLDHYFIYFYNGQLDLVIPYTSTVNFLLNLNFTGAEEYKTKLNYVLFMDGELMGYGKEAGKLGEIVVRNAGHMAPTDQPRNAKAVIEVLLMGRQ